MWIVNPLTTKTDITNVNSASSGIELLYKDKESQTIKYIKQTSNEAVSVSSTIGQNKSVNNLNHAQAKELLYRKHLFFQQENDIFLYHVTLEIIPHQLRT
jgi:hypothetical protein